MNFKQSKLCINSSILLLFDLYLEQLEFHRTFFLFSVSVLSLNGLVKSLLIDRQTNKFDWLKFPT